MRYCYEINPKNEGKKDAHLADVSESVRELVASWHRQHFADGTPLQGLSVEEEELAWAVATVRTRAFSVNVDAATRSASALEGGEEVFITTLAPFADMLNHNPDAPVSFDARSGHFEIKWNGVAQAGSEATLCYMAKADNRALLQTFGFSMAGNVYDRIRLPPAATLPGGGICKASLLQQLGLTQLGASEELMFTDCAGDLDQAPESSPARERVLCAAASIPFKRA
eukprot:gene7654-9118_t